MWGKSAICINFFAASVPAVGSKDSVTTEHNYYLLVISFLTSRWVVLHLFGNKNLLVYAVLMSLHFAILYATLLSISNL